MKPDNIHKPKILVIPSWYPNKDQTSGGSQFREQAEFFQQRYDVRVLFGTKSELSRLNWIKQNGLKHAGQYSQETTPAGLLEHRFEYKSLFKDERHQIGAMIQGYREALEAIINAGWKPDLIHARCTDSAGVVAASLAKDLDIPWVLSEHQVFALGNFSEYYAKLMRRAIKSASIVTVVSQHQLRSFVAHYIYRPLVVTGNLVDDEKFPISPIQEVRSPFKILTVMYPSPIKDPETFFRAIADLVQKGHDDIEVTIIGRKLFSQNDVEPFNKLIQGFDLEPYCNVIPFVPNDRLAEHYAEANVFVSTSLAETFGIAVREAMMVGRPVVCTASGGVDDDIFDFNGFKVDIYDYQAIADALIKIKTGQMTYDSSRIRNFVVSKYGRQAFFDRIGAIYEHALAKREQA